MESTVDQLGGAGFVKLRRCDAVTDLQGETCIGIKPDVVSYLADDRGEHPGLHVGAITFDDVPQLDEDLGLEVQMSVQAQDVANAS